MVRRMLLICLILNAGLINCSCWTKEREREKLEKRERETNMEVVKKPWPVWDVAFSPDGRWLAAGSGYRFTQSPPWGGEGEVLVWRVDGWKQQEGFSAPFTNMPQAVAFTADGKNVVAASDKYIRDARGNPRAGNVIFTWTVSDGSLAKTLAFNDQFDEQHVVNRGAGSVASLTLSPDGELIGLGRVGSASIVLQRMNGRRLYELKGNIGTYQSCAFSPAGKVLGSVTHLKPRVHLCDAANGKELANFDLKNEEPNCLGFSPDGKQIAVGVSDGSVRLLAADLSKQLRSLEVSDAKERVVALAYAAKADLLAAATPNGVRLFESSSGKRLRDWGKTDMEIRAIALSPDGKLLAVGYGGKYKAGGWPRGGFVNIWDTATGRLVKKLD